MEFIHDDFLLGNPSARRLFHEFARDEPILDFHNHLDAGDIANDRRFENLAQLWLDGDHYKWRAMRANGVSEGLITGDAPPFERFLAFARTVPQTIRGPLYIWTHLELRRCFGITDLLDESSARRIWDAANEQLAEPQLSARGLLRRFGVRALCTTDDPADTLEHHRTLRHESLGQGENGRDVARVFPTFRPDRAAAIEKGAAWNAWLNRLEQRVGWPIDSLVALLGALQARHEAFHDLGARLSDHGLTRVPPRCATASEAAEIFAQARRGEPIESSGASAWSGFVLAFCLELAARRDWTAQLHVGALRDNRTRGLESLGADAGFDSIGDEPQARVLGLMLDHLDQRGALGRTILYNINPADNYALASMIANFNGALGQGEEMAGKMQFGAAWWFLDQREGIEWQLNALSNLGLLGRFIGMLTDSRALPSLARHEYFRRILCDILGREMESGQIPRDFNLVGPLAQRLCYANARDFLRLPI